MTTPTPIESIGNQLDLFRKSFFVITSLAGLYYLAYLALLLHIILKSGTHTF